jgi:hypothetical protein
VKDERIIARIPRNASDEVVVRKANFWNIDIIDIRWYKDGNPTRKGIRVNMKEAKVMLQAIKKAMRDENGNEERDEEED